MWFRYVICCSVMTLLSISALAGANPKSPAEAAFGELSKLSGVWEGSAANGSKHRVAYKLTANNTVLVETWTMSSTRESMTLYALDGDRLLATHYCPQGNQPRLKFVGKDRHGKYQFEFQDGTNLQDPNGFHQHDFWVRLDLPNSFSRAEHYVQNSSGESESEVEKDETVSYRRINPGD